MSYSLCIATAFVAIASVFGGNGDGLFVTPSTLLCRTRVYFTISSIQALGVALSLTASGGHDFPAVSSLTPVKEVLARSGVASYFPEGLPEIDGYGSDLLYWSDGRSFVLVGRGADKKPDKDYNALLSGDALDPKLIYERLCKQKSNDPSADVTMVSDMWCNAPDPKRVCADSHPLGGSSGDESGMSKR